jgi:hypothetical protein
MRNKVIFITRAEMTSFILSRRDLPYVIYICNFYGYEPHKKMITGMVHLSS